MRVVDEPPPFHPTAKQLVGLVHVTDANVTSPALPVPAPGNGVNDQAVPSHSAIIEPPTAFPTAMQLVVVAHEMRLNAPAVGL
jgi:hypothetical protein